MRVLGIIIIALLFFNCKKSGSGTTPEPEPEIPPGVSLLEYPENNSECTTGISINDLLSEVEFRWAAAENADSYTLSITNLNTGFTQSTNTTALRLSLPIDKGTPYSWQVTSRKTGVLETTNSNNWAFYNSGFVTEFIPFPAEIVYPKIGNNAFIDLNNEIRLDWSGADLDNDIVSYDLYFSTTSPPTTLLTSTGADITEQAVTVVADTIYYWKVITKDAEGNSSDSGVYSFKAL